METHRAFRSIVGAILLEDEFVCRWGRVKFLGSAMMTLRDLLPPNTVGDQLRQEIRKIIRTHGPRISREHIIAARSAVVDAPNTPNASHETPGGATHNNHVHAVSEGGATVGVPGATHRASSAHDEQESGLVEVILVDSDEGGSDEEEKLDLEYDEDLQVVDSEAENDERRTLHDEAAQVIVLDSDEFESDEEQTLDNEAVEVIVRMEVDPNAAEDLFPIHVLQHQPEFHPYERILEWQYFDGVLHGLVEWSPSWITEDQLGDESYVQVLERRRRNGVNVALVAWEHSWVPLADMDDPAQRDIEERATRRWRRGTDVQ